MKTLKRIVAVVLAFLMLFCMIPYVINYHYFTDPGNLEYSVLAFLDVICPDIEAVCGELERFDKPVSCLL